MSRVILLSSVEPNLRPDTDLGDIVRDVLVALSSHPGCEVVQREVASLADIKRVVAEDAPDLVFNTCETLGGESRNESMVPLLLEQLGVPFTGASSRCLRNCLRKADSTRILRDAGVPVPETFRVGAGSDLRSIPSRLYPFIVKPEREDGSVGIDDDSVVESPEALSRVAQKLAAQGYSAIAQRYIEGREIVLALAGWPVPRVLPPGELLYDAEAFAGRARVVTYAAKWEEDSVDYVAVQSVGAEVTARLLQRLSAHARRAFEVLGMRDYGRVDFRVDARGRPYVIDLNPNCDISSDGGFMRAFGRAGLSHGEALRSILADALLRAKP